MREWNAVITVFDGGFSEAFRILKDLGAVQKSDFYNVLLMKCPDPFRALQVLHEQRGPIDVERVISRFMPLERLFTFQTAEEFEARCRESVDDCIPRLSKGSFHVRMHRRGFKGKLSSVAEERFLDDYILERLTETGTTGRISFDEFDAVVIVETVGTQGGLSLFSREQVRRFPLLHVD